jgi:hypothetical protein
VHVTIFSVVYLYIEKFPITQEIKCLNFKDGKIINFVKVKEDDIYELVNNLVLSGVYQDKTKKRNMFLIVNVKQYGLTRLLNIILIQILPLRLFTIVLMY